MNNESTTEVATGATSVTSATSADSVEQTTSAEQAKSEGGIVDELLIEEISIDGMCGVY